MANYEESHGFYPPSHTCAPPQKGSDDWFTGRHKAHSGWGALLLPYIEEAPLYRMYDFNFPTVGAPPYGIDLNKTLTDEQKMLKQRTHEFARDHAGNRGMKALANAADALPWIGFAGAAIAALDGSDPVRQRTGFAALEAGATGFLAATGLKYGFGRARPDTGAGNRSFRPGSSDDAHHSLPSRHSTVAWALATPFALEYGAPWLYGVAALTNLGRVADRQHWFSDTVAGSLLGYGIGRIFWEAGRARGKNSPHVFLTPSGVNLAWEIQ